MRIALTAKSIAIYYTLPILIPDNKAFARPDKLSYGPNVLKHFSFPTTLIESTRSNNIMNFMRMVGLMMMVSIYDTMAKSVGEKVRNNISKLAI